MILYDGQGNEIDVSGGGGDTPQLLINNAGYQRATISPGINNVFANMNEHSGQLDSNNTSIYYSTVAWTNPSEKHVVYLGAWVKFNYNAKVYSLMHKVTPPVNIILQDMSQDGKGGELIGSLITKMEVPANTWTYIYGTITSNGGGSNATSNSIMIVSAFEDNSTYLTATMSVKDGVLLDLTDIFGKGYEPTADGVKALLSGSTDYYITTNYDIFTSSMLKGLSQYPQITTKNGQTPYIDINDESQIIIKSTTNKNWTGWNHPQYSYPMKKTLAPMNMDIHGGVETDSYFSCVPIWGPWTENADNVPCLWGGHVFHGWNSCQTYRLTMMASGNMSDNGDENYIPREDEFCIQVFSPSVCYDNPIGLTEEQAEHRVVRDVADRLKGDHYYGRIRIGSDEVNMGFLFRCRSLTCYGDVDINGKKLILGDQAGEHNVPATRTSGGKAGQISYDSDYLYVCVADNIWKRVALATW